MSLKTSVVSTTARNLKKKTVYVLYLILESQLAAMDWLKLFALLVVVVSVRGAREAPKKKIRIHLPQKVKHIHHHKKIYITNHPARHQYAPAFMPSAESAVAVSTNVAMPTVARVVSPYNSLEMYDEPPTRLPAITSAASKILPLYRARGYYGPSPADWDDEEDQHDSSDGSYIPTAFASPPAAAAPPASHHKRVKYVKLEGPIQKKAPRKGKSKRVLFRGKSQMEEEHPVSTFHEQFYSDLGGSGTIRKIRKPQRVEKIIDGDTEHIHTYSEEHIHKIVFDDGSQATSVVGIDPVGHMAAFAPSHHLIPMKSAQSLLALPSDALTGFTEVGSLGTPSHLEYTAYNPREVTHDHIIHDHGEIPSDVEITKGHSTYPSRHSHGVQGAHLGTTKGYKNKYTHQYLKPTKLPQPNDYSHYENMYSPYSRLRNIQKPVTPTVYAPENDVGLEDLQAYRPIPAFKVKEKGSRVKSRNVVPALYFDNGKSVSDHRVQQAKTSAPYAVSSTIVHDYKPKQYMAHGTGNHEVTSFDKELYNYPNSFEVDSYASSSNIYSSDSPVVNYKHKKGKNKSISTQNISFGGLDHQTAVDHIADSSVAATSIDGGEPLAEASYDMVNSYGQSRLLDTISSTAYTIKESSPVYPYYSLMAVKALHGEQQPLGEASNDNFQYAEAPAPLPPTAPEAIMGTPASEYYNIQDSEPIATEPIDTDYETKPKHSSKETITDEVSVRKEPKRRYKVMAIHSGPAHSRRESHKNSGDTPSAVGNLKYGDRI